METNTKVAMAYIMTKQRLENTKNLIKVLTDVRQMYNLNQEEYTKMLKRLAAPHLSTNKNQSAS